MTMGSLQQNPQVHLPTTSITFKLTLRTWPVVLFSSLIWLLNDYPQSDVCMGIQPCKAQACTHKKLEDTQKATLCRLGISNLSHQTFPQYE